jgi:hypothetical protein
MYADDHRPPHFHVAGPDFEAIIDIASLKVLDGNARAKQIEPAMRWARANQALLRATWIELNERG